MEVNRWKRYGHDRLYVKSASGNRVGWWDLHLDQPEPGAAGWRLELLSKAAAEWKEEQAVVPHCQVPA